MLSDALYSTFRHCSVVFFRRRRDWIPLMFCFSLLVLLSLISNYSLTEPTTTIVYDPNIHIVYVEDTYKPKRFTVRKELTELEKHFYYNDGSFRRNFTKPELDEDTYVYEWEKDLNSVKTPPEWQCHPGNLHFNDTDEARDLDPCAFPDISRKPVVNQRINALSPMHLPILRNYRNPCWYETIPESTNYHNSVYSLKARESFARIELVMDRRKKQNHRWKLRCLPLVYIIGLQHCGGDDLYEMLMKHPFITPGAIRETNYWDATRWLTNSTFSDYLDLFDEAAEEIRKVRFPGVIDKVRITHHPIVTVDGSSRYLYQFQGGHYLNPHDPEPTILPAHIIHNLTPKTDIKILLLIRNPTDRLFYSYCSSNPEDGLSSEEFHTLASVQVTKIRNCLNDYTLKSCLYNSQVTKSTKDVQVHSGIYYGYIKEWISVFPQMKIIRWEDYRSRRNSIYRKVLQYIGLYPEKLDFPSDYVPDVPEPAIQMLDKTKYMLNEFYRPYNKLLAELLNNNTKFLFED